ncbi:MAG: DNA polymerase III subunit chi [Gammaproteobacteria bacterium]|nr:DNA polymerase III subunit chi [Gammaproteobacteria bacterium]
MNAVFWILSEQHQAPSHAAEQDVSAHLHYACVLTADLYRQNKKILFATENQDQAQLVDEWLWQFEAERFVPHNLPGEGPHYGTPVEINWQPSQQRRGCFVNLCAKVPDYHSQLKGLSEWHDFVPADEAGKALARERYKQLKQLGFQITTNPIPDTIV